MPSKQLFPFRPEVVSGIHGTGFVKVMISYFVFKTVQLSGTAISFVEHCSNALVPLHGWMKPLLGLVNGNFTSGVLDAFIKIRK